MKHHISFDLELRKNPYPGLYIALEGIDGSGKTTQAQELAKYYESKGYATIVTAEPTRDGEVGGLVHRILTGEVKIPRKFNQYIFSADRGIHQEKLIIPSLKDGKVVISDRSFWSTLAYGILDQESVDGKIENRDQLLVAYSILSLYHQFITPDVSVVLKLDVDTAVERLQAMSRKKELYENREMLVEVESIYEWMLNKFSEDLISVDGRRHIDEVTVDIVRHANKFKKKPY
ncbi:MAG TPA: dTMP kinase [Patescibacteria group bacterium]|nr:dTMP kinase [Patescibacteria group bacterium]